MMEPKPPPSRMARTSSNTASSSSFLAPPEKDDDEAVFDEVRAIRNGGGFGSIIGRNSFQRPKEHALKFLDTIMKIHAGEVA